MKSIIALVIGLSVVTLGAGELTLTVLEKTQDSVLREDGAARYTVRYVSTDSQRTNTSSWVMDEPREGSMGAIQYRGAVDRTVIFPEKFAQVGDMICQTNIGGTIYLYAIPMPPPPTVTTNRFMRHRHQKQGQTYSVPSPSVEE
jgi:hypothetical protein